MLTSYQSLPELQQTQQTSQLHHFLEELQHLQHLRCCLQPGRGRRYSLGILWEYHQMAVWKIWGLYPACHSMKYIWLVVSMVSIPLKNDGAKVSWDYDIPNWMESHSKFHGSSHHQPDIEICKSCRFFRSDTSEIPSVTMIIPRDISPIYKGYLVANYPRIVFVA